MTTARYSGIITSAAIAIDASQIRGVVGGCITGSIG